jgi:hypothetical protein
MVHRFELEGIHDRGSRDCDCLPELRAQTCQNLLTFVHGCRRRYCRAYRVGRRRSFGVSASSAIRCRRMARALGGATPKAVLARPALDARRPSCGCPFERSSMRPQISPSKSSRRRWPCDTSGKLRARCGASLTATRSRANKAAASTEQNRPDIVKRRDIGLGGRRGLADEIERPGLAVHCLTLGRTPRGKRMRRSHPLTTAPWNSPNGRTGKPGSK